MSFRPQKSPDQPLHDPAVKLSFWQRLNAKRAVKDFAGEWQRPSPHRWPVLGVAMAITFTMFWTMVPEDQRGYTIRPDIIYVSSWFEGRSDDEIIAGNEANQTRKDERAALRKRREELRKDMYRSLGRATGIDVDEIEADIEAAEAAEAVAEAVADAVADAADEPAIGETETAPTNSAE